PESHAASFALLAYASAYFKAHYPAAFYTALLNNQPMGFYHPATLVKDAQRRGVIFAPIDVQVSDWDCTVEPGGMVRLGLRYVRGLRAEAGQAIAKKEERRTKTQSDPTDVRCPKCGCDDRSMIEMEPATGNRHPATGVQMPALRVRDAGSRMPDPGMRCFCNVCSHQW